MEADQLVLRSAVDWSNIYDKNTPRLSKNCIYITLSLLKINIDDN